MRYVHDNGYGHGGGSSGGSGGADPRLLRANEELRRVLRLIEDPNARLLPRHVYEALERRMQRWSRVVETLILDERPDGPRRIGTTGRDAA